METKITDPMGDALIRFFQEQGVRFKDVETGEYLFEDGKSEESR